MFLFLGFHFSLLPGDVFMIVIIVIVVIIAIEIELIQPDPL